MRDVRIIDGAVVTLTTTLTTTPDPQRSAPTYELICPRCLSPFQAPGDALVGTPCPTCAPLFGSAPETTGAGLDLNRLRDLADAAATGDWYREGERIEPAERGRNARFIAACSPEVVAALLERVARVERNALQQIDDKHRILREYQWRVAQLTAERDTATRELAEERAVWTATVRFARERAEVAITEAVSLRERADRAEQDAARLEDALAKRCLADLNSARENEDDWPAGQQWDDLVGSSRSIFRRRAREEAGVARTPSPSTMETSE